METIPSLVLQVQAAYQKCSSLRPLAQLFVRNPLSDTPKRRPPSRKSLNLTFLAWRCQSSLLCFWRRTPTLRPKSTQWWIIASLRAQPSTIYLWHMLTRHSKVSTRRTSQARRRKSRLSPKSSPLSMRLHHPVLSKYPLSQWLLRRQNSRPRPKESSFTKLMCSVMITVWLLWKCHKQKPKRPNQLLKSPKPRWKSEWLAWFWRSTYPWQSMWLTMLPSMSLLLRMISLQVRLIGSSTLNAPKLIPPSLSSNRSRNSQSILQCQPHCSLFSKRSIKQLRPWDNQAGRSKKLCSLTCLWPSICPPRALISPL